MHIFLFFVLRRQSVLSYAGLPSTVLESLCLKKIPYWQILVHPRFSLSVLSFLPPLRAAPAPMHLFGVFQILIVKVIRSGFSVFI